jgi:FkbM family methyltransferase
MSSQINAQRGPRLPRAASPVSSRRRERGLGVLTKARERLNKPYYVFRPSQVVRRAVLPLRRRRLRGDFDQITLPWGLPLKFRAREKSGLSYARRGIFDLPVCEALWRLADPGELAVDVGANIGQMTSALAARVGGGGRVIAFEPHPELFSHLSENVEKWNKAPGTGAIELRNLGASSSEGTAELAMSAGFEWNRGTASMAAQPDDGAMKVVQVPVRRLDDELSSDTVGVMKLDVEGYELEVLRGAERLLAEGRIRDIVFEDFGEQPTPVTRLLEDAGYTVFGIDQALLGPLASPAAAGPPSRSGEDPSYVATRDPARAVARFGKRGWGALGVGPRFGPTH